MMNVPMVRIMRYEAYCTQSLHVKSLLNVRHPQQNPQLGGGLLQAAYNLIWGRIRGNEPAVGTDVQGSEDHPD